MALGELFGMIDNRLKEVFDRKGVDPAKARRPLLKGIERTAEQFRSGAKGPNQWWRVKNGVVALTVKVAGDTFDINGVATNHMPEDRFLEFLDWMRDAVDAGTFDEELAHKGNGDAKVHIPKRNAGLSEEAAKARGAKAAATRKANREAKAAG